MKRKELSDIEMEARAEIGDYFIDLLNYRMLFTNSGRFFERRALLRAAQRSYEEAERFAKKKNLVGALEGLYQVYDSMRMDMQNR